MSEPGSPAPAADEPSHLQADLSEALHANELLRAELQKLKNDNAELERKLKTAQAGSLVDLSSRRAALNLMEDAVHARQAEQRENAERKKVEEELRVADRRKDEFLATLAHELRNPLAPIRNSIHILRVAGADGGVVTQLYEMMERQVNQMVRLVDDLMEVSRITRGKIELRRESIELAAIIRTAVETSRPIIDKACHQLAISFPPDPLILDGDPLRLSQVLSNLLNNAAKYTEDGGQIRLTARREGSEVIISVEDNGIGIPRDMLPRVFDLFTQADRAYSRAQGGLGIGLTLARTLVQLHGGSLDAHSAGTDQGSVFVVRLPLAVNPYDRHEAEPSQQQKGCIEARRVLVADDNRDAADSLAQLLELMGMDVRTANSGNSTLKCIEEFRPSVVLLDIGMPGMDGIETAKQIRRNWSSSKLTLIALTGWGQEEDRRRTTEAGFDHHLVKPIDPEILHSLFNSISSPVKAPHSAGNMQFKFN